MDRREFGVLVSAGLLFPQNLVKGLVDDPFEPASEERMRHLRRMVPKKFLIVSVGSDEHPASKDYFAQTKIRFADSMLADFLIFRSKLWQDTFPFHLSPMPRTYEMVTTEHLVLGVGSKRRPVSETEYLDFRDEVICRLGRGEDIIVTPHAITACNMRIFHGDTPLVLRFDDPLIEDYFARRLDYVRKQWESWDRQQRMDVAMAIGGGP